MSNDKDTGTDKLLQELENLKDTLSEEQHADKDNFIPTLEEVVGHEKTIQQRKENPFLSSETLAQLISKRNDAEAKAAEELARIIRQNRITPVPDSDLSATHSLFDLPDPLTKPESRFETPIELPEEEEFIFPKEEVIREDAQNTTPEQHQLTAEDLLDQLHQELGGIIQEAIDKVLPSFVQKIEMEVMLKLEALIIEQSHHDTRHSDQSNEQED
ncbi:hypothetical protein [Gynuella sunshinyii]|uniref:Uncharacterized protein n=1 Tax=Gynuella sunshinyii YC6258 TaxID=1445510 RepID=A0A0C5VWU0_9GAMM|nr:hypothetical protein [Gynuella sunshinyii]AJQ94924.1 hypothetical Protein YC6258_02886 [Gynuella sunshinyii YC6258]